jgi:di/tricarboxylate transporter
MEKCNLLTSKCGILLFAIASTLDLLAVTGIALRTLLYFRSPRALLLCFMLLTWFMSAWMSNVAVVAIMFPMLTSILERLRNPPHNTGGHGDDGIESQANDGAAVGDDGSTTENAAKALEHAELVDRYSTASLIAVAYCASIGGIATPVGTGPNLIFLGLFRQMFPSAIEIGFGSWLLFAMPVSFLITLVLWLYLSFVHCRYVWLTVLFNLNLHFYDEQKCFRVARIARHDRVATRRVGSFVEN